MAINKVMDSIGKILIDLTNDTVTPDKVLQGYTFHDRSGTAQIGNLTSIPTATSKHAEDNVVRFIDYNGDIVAEYTIAEANALTELPVPPSHDRIIFECWNHTLQQVQETTHSLCVGALYTTVDDAIYFKLSVNTNMLSQSVYFRYYPIGTGTFIINWGDGNSDTVTISSTSTSYSSSPAHTYTNVGIHIIKITLVDANIRIAYSSVSNENNAYCGLYPKIFREHVLEINIPSWHTYYNSSIGRLGFAWSKSLQAVSIPSNFPGLTLNYAFYYVPVKCYIYSLSTSNLFEANDSTYSALPLYVSVPRIAYARDWYGLGGLLLLINKAIGSLIFPEKVYSNDGTTISEYTDITWSLSTSYLPRPCDNKYLKYIYISNLWRNKRIYMVSMANSSSNWESCALQKIDGSYGCLLCQSNYQYWAYSFKDKIINPIPNMSEDVNLNYIYRMNFGPNQEKIVFPSNVKSFNLQLDDCQQAFEYLDLSTHETPPTLTGLNMSYICFKILVMPGTLSLYQSETNWSTLYAAGLIEEATI